MGSCCHRWSLPALLAVAWLTSACTGDISGGGGPTGTEGGDPPPGGEPPPPGGEPAEPSDWFGAVQQADCSVPRTLSRTRIRRLSTIQWQNTVALLGAALPAV